MKMIVFFFAKLNYRISANSFHGKYSFLNLAKKAETIQGRKLFKGGN